MYRGYFIQVVDEVGLSLTSTWTERRWLAFVKHASNYILGAAFLLVYTCPVPHFNS